MINIGILVPVCSRNQNFENINQTPLIKILLPSILNTKEDEYNYIFFIGYDNDDEFYKSQNENLRLNNFNVFELEGCQHAPAKAWNILFEKAINYHDKIDYFFQIGDDVQIKTKGWTTKFIKKLQTQNDIGVIGPCEPINYAQRGGRFVIENSFVSRKHYSIFNSFFHPEIKNWYCDNWITLVYGNLASMDCDIIVSNEIRDNRYKIDNINQKIVEYVEQGRESLKKYL